MCYTSWSRGDGPAFMFAQYINRAIRNTGSAWVEPEYCHGLAFKVIFRSTILAFFCHSQRYFWKIRHRRILMLQVERKWERAVPKRNFYPENFGGLHRGAFLANKISFSTGHKQTNRTWAWQHHKFSLPILKENRPKGRDDFIDLIDFISDF